MSWKIRHEGSPKSVDVPSLQQVAEGLADGRWEATDEVMGPQDKGWVAIESHPRLAEVAADLEPPPPHRHEDESHLDMNALIDVCLVLLIFFMLMLIYAVAVQKMINSPNLTADADNRLPVKTQKEVEDLMIQVKVTQEAKGPVIRIETREVAKDDVGAALRAAVRSTRKATLLLEYDRDVPHGHIVAIEDAAKTAGINDVLIVVPKEEVGK